MRKQPQLLEILAGAEVERIHEASLRILAEVGVRLPNRTILDSARPRAPTSTSTPRSSAPRRLWSRRRLRPYQRTSRPCRPMAVRRSTWETATSS